MDIHVVVKLFQGVIEEVKAYQSKQKAEAEASAYNQEYPDKSDAGTEAITFEVEIEGTRPEYRVTAYLRVDPEDEETYSSKEEAEKVKDQLEAMQPKDKFEIEEVNNQ